MLRGDSPMKPFDVVVIGGGPAGSAASISCAQRGLRTALIERDEFPRFRPGESLHPGVEPVLQQLGVAGQLCAQDALRFSGYWVQWHEPLRFNGFGSDDNGPWQGFQIPRETLDTTLLKQAATLGVRVLQPCRALAVLSEKHRVTGVRTDSGPLHADYVIDASGASAWLHRQLGLTIRHCSPRLIARYGYVRGCPSVYQNAPHLSADPNGWTWIAKVQAHLTHWTHLTFDAPDVHSTAVPQPLQHLPMHGPLHGADVTWRLSTAAAGGGYFTVGDAASQLDPASSHGVLKALMTGMQAAQAVCDCVGRPSVQSSAQRQYSQWLGDWFEKDMAQLRHFYRLHPDPPRWLQPRD